MKRLLLGASVGLVGFLVALVPAAGAGPAADPTVTISANCGSYEFCFTPATITITDGQTVTWSNQSGAEHIVARCDPPSCDYTSPGTGTDPNFTSGDVPVGGTFSHTFHGSGTYPYLCTIHGYMAMHGEVVVEAATPPPTDVPTDPTTATTTTASTASTAPPTSGPAGATTTPVTAAAAQLARTGSETGGALAIGLAAVGLGALAMGVAAVATQRRRARP